MSQSRLRVAALMILCLFMGYMLGPAMTIADPPKLIPPQTSPLDRLEARIANLEDAVLADMERLDALEECLRVEDGVMNGLEGPHLIIEGCNVHVRNGNGGTENTINGLGNLIVGYNEPIALGPVNRQGSHNLVIGAAHNYSSWGGVVAGVANTVSGPACTVVGGGHSEASGGGASVVGGRFNVADGIDAVVLGGEQNCASGLHATVSGGAANEASGTSAMVSGGQSNLASGNASAVLGGSDNESAGFISSVSGGSFNLADASLAAVSGGLENVASGAYSVVSGGSDNVASGVVSVVSGGELNEASGTSATVSGGLSQVAPINGQHVP